MAIAILFSQVSVSNAQFTNDPVSISMGNSNLITTGYRAIYQNPANLMLKSDIGKWQIGFFEAGVYHNHDGIAFDGSRRKYIEESYRPFNFNVLQLSENQRQDLLDRWFPANIQRFDKVSTLSTQLFGMSYTGDDIAIGLSARLRSYSTMSISKGWYDDIPQIADSTTHIQRNLRQQAGAWLEVSLALARDLDFFTGMTADNNKLNFGIAPKIIVAGPHIDVTYDATYTPAGGGDLDGEHAYDVRSSGFFSPVIRDYFNNRQDPFQITIPENTSWLDEVTGIGFGTDFGLTYDIKLGSGNGYAVADNSVQLSLALTDLGFIVYNKDVYSRTSDVNAVYIDQAESGDLEPTGRIGDWFYLIEEQPGDASTLDVPVKVETNSITYGLPAAVHGGLSLKYGKTHSIVQISSGLNLQAGNLRHLRIGVGSEVRPINWLPLRGGMMIDTIYGSEITLGAGIDVRHYAISVGSRIRIPQGDQSWLPTAAGVGALQIRF